MQKNTPTTALVFRIVSFVILFCISHLSRSQESLSAQKINSAKSLSGNDLFGAQKSFIENVGQFETTLPGTNNPEKIKYGFEGFDMPVLFSSDKLIFLLKKKELLSEKEKEKFERDEKENEENDKEQREAMRIITMQWLGTNPQPQIITEDQTSSYFTFGMLPDKAHGYKKIIYKNLYPNIDLVFSFTPENKTGFEYSFILKPGADINSIKIKFDGDIKNIKSSKQKGLIINTNIGGFEHSMPIGYYENENNNAVPVLFHITKNIVSFKVDGNYDKTKTFIIDPFISSTSNLTGLNAGKAKDIDFDYAGNIYVSGGGDGATNHKLAKYDASGALQWTFSGVLSNPPWQFGTYYGGWVVEKPTGKVYLGQGFEYVHGFSIIRLNSDGLYDNYITTANPSFREDWKMFWNCNNGSPQILIAGGGTNSNINFGVCNPPSTTISSLNITGIPYTGTDGWAQDIADIVIDPVNSDMYTIYGSLYGTPSLSNKIYKNKAPYSSATIQWNLYSGFTSVQEISNRPYLSGSEIDNACNVLAINSSYFYYWDGKNLKAFNKTTGATVGTPLTIATNSNLMSGGIIADECNNIFVGSTNGTIKVYKFNGSTFDDAAAPDITIAGYTTKSVYDLGYNESQRLLYASGDGFVASFDISSYACPSTSYTLTVAPNCAAGTATVTISPAPPVGSTVTYVLFDGGTQIASNSTGVFTGLSPGITYTVKVYVNQVCSGTLTVTTFTLLGPALALTHTDATCGNATGTITATGSGGTGPYTYSKDGTNFQSSGTFTNLAAGLYIITVKDAGGCKTSDSIIIKNTNGPALSFTKKDAQCGNNNGSITATGTGGTPPYQYSIDGINFQSSNIFNGLGGGNYTLTIKDANGCTNVASASIGSSIAPQVTALGVSTTCSNNNGGIIITATGGVQPYQYSINGNTYQTSNTFSNLPAGSYTATVKDANGCIGTAPVTINNSAGPTVTAVATTASCNNINGSITATGTGGAAPLQYSIDGVFFQTNNIFTGLAAGTYTITVKDANGCTATTAATVSNTNGPGVTATSTASACNLSTGTITATATGSSPFQYSINGFSYQFSNIFTSLAAGNYIVYVKDVNGCIGTATINVGTTAGPQISAVVTNTSCASADGKITATGTGGTAPLQYSINGTAYQSSNIFTGLSTGNYTITVKDANGCTANTNVFVDNADGLHLTASSIATNCSANNGSITATATGGVGALQYSIDGITYQSSNVFTNVASGSYTVTVKDANGCKATASVTVASSSGISVTAVAGNSCSNKNGTITATGFGGTAPLTYSIDGINFQSSGFFYNLTPGTYTVTVKDATGCTNTTTATIVNVTGSGPTVTAKFHDAHSCSGDGPFGRIDNISASGGTPPYTFSLDGGPFISTTQFLNVPAGTHTVTVKDANGCTGTIKGTIVDVPAPTVTATVTNTPCGSSTGTIKATGHGGSSPYTYSLNGGPFQSSGTFTGLSAGTYTVTVQDDEGCFGSIQVTVLNTGGPTLTATKTDATCGKSNGSITATGSGGTGSLSYNINGGFYQSSGVFTGLAAGTYNVTVRDATGCTSGTTVTINDPGAPTASAVSTPATCNINNGTITVTASGGTAPLKYSIDGTVFQTSNQFTNLAPGFYTITIGDAGGCSGKTTATVGKTAIPQVSAFTVAASCNNNDGSITASATSGTTPYTFSIDGVVFQSSNTFTGLKAGAYTVTVKDASGCTNTTGVVLANSGGPQISTVATATTCGNNNGSISISAAGGTSPYQYSIDGISYQASGTYTNLAAGTYTVSVKDAKGCLNSKTTLIAESSGPQQVNTTVTDASCNTNNGKIIVTANGGVAPYTYSIDGITYQSSNTFSNLAASTYTVTVKDVNGCTKSTTAKINNLLGPAATATATDASCGKSDGSIVTTATGGSGILQYSINGTTFQTNNVFTGLAAGNYTVTVKDANNCITTTNVTVNGSGGPAASATSSNATCGSNNGSITASATGGTAPYSYSIDGINFQTSNVFNGLAVNTYTVTVKDANGCINTTTATVTNTGGPIASATSSNATCGSSNGSITASATGGTAPYSYSIDGINFQTSNIFTGLASNTYTVTVKDANGCKSTASVSVANTGGPTASATSSNATCGSSNGSITASATGGTAPYSYSIDGINFQTSNTFTGLASNTYTVTVKDANGCKSTASVSVANTGGPTASATSSDATCGSSNGSITASATGGTAPYSYSIDGINFQTSNTFTGLASNTYTVTVKDANGCKSTASVSVANTGGPTASATSSNATCGSSNGSITASATGGTAPYSYSIDGINFQTSNVFNGLTANTYTVTVKDANGCINTTTTKVTNTGGPTASATSSSATCGSSNGSITATATGGTAPYSYSIDGINFQTSNVFTGLASNTYTVTVKDANGCINITSTIINSINTISVDAGNDITVCAGTNIIMNATSDGDTFSWFPPDGLSNATVLNPVAGPAVTTKYYLTSSLSACSAIDSVTVFINPLPVADAGTNENICYGNSIQLHGANGMNYLWSPATYLSSTTVADPLVVKPLHDITYYLAVTDSNGCTSALPDSVSIFVHTPARVYAGKDTAIAMNEPLQLNASNLDTAGIVRYLWVPAYALSDSHIQNPIATPDKEITYTVFAYTANDCVSSDNIIVTVYQGPDIYVPTAFTPNGDKLNDVEKAFPVGLKEFTFFNIYSRFGELVFTTSDPSVGWDGIYKGEKQNAGTFAWQAKGIDFKGNIIYRKGTVVLIR